MTTQQYREVKRKAAVGERIKIVAASYTMGRYDNGDEFVVNHVDRDDDVYVSIDGKDRLICLSEFVVLEPIAQPIAPSPLGTSFLSSDPLYAAFRQFVADNADELRKLLPEIDPPGISVGGIVGAPVTVADSDAVIARTPKLTRAQVIAKATADVAELLRIGLDDDAFLNEDGHFHGRWFDVTFAVNREKRAVTALIYELDGFAYKRKSGGPHAKFTAKCSPADVFHAEIGKAIALRKALGLAVPTEYTDAPQPDKAYAGAKVSVKSGRDEAHQNVFTVSKEYVGYIDHLCEDYVNETLPAMERTAVIIDDTDVDYSVNADSAVSAKGAAA